MNKVDRLLSEIFEEWDDDLQDCPDPPNYTYDDLSPAEKKEYDQKYKELDKPSSNRTDDLEGFVIHGPGYHDEPYCGGY